MSSNLCLAEPIELNQQTQATSRRKHRIEGSWSTTAVVLPAAVFALGCTTLSTNGPEMLSRLLFMFWASLGIWFMTALLSSANNEPSKNIAWTAFPTLILLYMIV